MSYNRAEIDLSGPFLIEGPAVGAHTGMKPFSIVRGSPNLADGTRRYSKLRARDDNSTVSVQKTTRDSANQSIASGLSGEFPWTRKPPFHVGS